MRLVSVTLEVTPDDDHFAVPRPIQRLLGIQDGDEVEYRVTSDGAFTEATGRIGEGGQLTGDLALPSSTALLTIWAPEARNVEDAPGGAVQPAGTSTDALYQLAKELDPAGTGVGVRELRRAAAERLSLPSGPDGYRYVYSLVNSAKDRFERSGRGRFRWIERKAGGSGGLGGRELIGAALALHVERDPSNHGMHYQDLVRGLEAVGTPVKGPDSGRTMYSNLVGPVGARTFDRVGAGVFRRKSG